MSYSKFNNLNRLSLRKNCFALLQTIFTFSCLISLITCQNTEAEDLSQSKVVLGMGTGTLTVLICIIIGIIICIFGLAFSSRSNMHYNWDNYLYFRFGLFFPRNICLYWCGSSSFSIHYLYILTNR